MSQQIAGIVIPDSVLAMKAQALVRGASGDALYFDSLRTYVFGALAAATQGMRYDAELFYLSAILHDLGLTDAYGGTGRFEVAGADAADAFLIDEGVAEERRALVWEAIALHTSVGIATRRRPEVALVHIGAAIDVLGLGLADLPHHLVAETIEALPRCDFKRVLKDSLLARIARDPAGAAVTWMSDIGRRHIHGFDCVDFVDGLNAAPFSE